MKKHRNDVCRLAMLLAGGEHPAMSKGIRADMQQFMEAYESDPVDPKALKIKGVGALFSESLFLSCNTLCNPLAT